MASAAITESSTLVVPVPWLLVSQILGPVVRVWRGDFTGDGLRGNCIHNFRTGKLQGVHLERIFFQEAPDESKRAPTGFEKLAWLKRPDVSLGRVWLGACVACSIWTYPELRRQLTLFLRERGLPCLDFWGEVFRARYPGAMAFVPAILSLSLETGGDHLVMIFRPLSRLFYSRRPVASWPVC